MKWLCRAVLCVALACLSTPLYGEEPAPPSMEQIQKRFDTGDYNGTLRDLARVLSLHGKAVEGYDPYDLLMLRGEAYLRLKETSSASAAFKQAAAQTTDPQQQAIAAATDVLIRRARQFQYTPRHVQKGAKAEPLDIIDPEKRKQALEALYHDEREAAATTLQSGKKATTLPQIAAAVKAIQAHELIVLDRAAHGNADDVKEAAADLKQRAQDLMSKALDRLAKSEQEISSRADEMVRYPSPRVGQPDVARRRGLQGGDREQLTTISRQCAKIKQAAVELMSVLGDGPSDADDLSEQADGIRQNAEKAIRMG